MPKKAREYTSFGTGRPLGKTKPQRPKHREQLISEEAVVSAATQLRLRREFYARHPELGRRS